MISVDSVATCMYTTLTEKIKWLLGIGILLCLEGVVASLPVGGLRAGPVA